MFPQESDIAFQHIPTLLGPWFGGRRVNVDLSMSVALMDEVKGVSPWAFPSSNAQAKRKALTITNQQAKTHPEAFPHLLIFSGKWIHVIYFHTQEYFFASNRLSALKCCEFPLESFSSVKG